MLFKVLKGRHGQDGKTYCKDDIVDTEVDLVATFGSNKFSRELQLEMEQKQAAPVVTASAKKTKQQAETPAPADLGIDVSKKFKDAEPNNLTVYKNGSLYFVVDNDVNPSVPQNEVGLKKDQVAAFIDSLFEE